jgi:hypothetical protein
VGAAREQARAISLASVAPSKIRGRAEFGLYLRTSVGSNPSSTNCRRALPTVLTLVSNAAAISPSVQPSPASEVSAFSRMRAFVINCALHAVHNAPPLPCRLGETWAVKFSGWSRMSRCCPCRALVVRSAPGSVRNSVAPSRLISHGLSKEAGWPPDQFEHVSHGTMHRPIRA